MGLGAAAESICQFSSPLNVLADVYGPGCKCPRLDEALLDKLFE